MKQEFLKLGRVPALIWGEASGHVILAVHGNMSNKMDASIALLAEEAVPNGYQVLSFDLPEHGDRKDEGLPCKVRACIEDLESVLRFAKGRWADISLFGCSMGVYFGLLACRRERLHACWFLSPVVDMERLVGNMMLWSGVTPERLEAEREIATQMGQTFYWDDYRYVREHPIDRWDVPTCILYGGKDELCEREAVAGFAERFGCKLEILEDSGHFFHTEEQMACLKGWLERNIGQTKGRNEA